MADQRPLVFDASGKVIKGLADTDATIVGTAVKTNTGNLTLLPAGSSIIVPAGKILGTTTTGNINLPNNASAKFQVEGVAVGSTVTAANLNTLSNGSNADALHTHAGGGSVPTSFVLLATKWVTQPDSMLAELAGGSSWQPTEHDYSGARTVKFRVVLAAQINASNVRVRLWSMTDGAYVTDLDGSSNNYLQTSSTSGAVLTSVDLRTGHTNFTVGTSGRIYEVHVNSESLTTRALLYKAEFVIGP